MRDLSLRVVISAIADRFTQEIANARRRLADLGGEAGAADIRVGGFRRQIDRALLSVFDFGGALRQLVVGFSLLAALAGVKSLIEFADRLRLIEGRIRNASSGLVDFARNYAALVSISLKTGTAFAENAEMFGRIAGGIRDMGGSSQDALRQVDLLAKGMSLSNTGTAEAASTVRQWSQAMASGLLRGDEFNSIMENAPRLAQAIANGLHVSIGSLRSMAEAGELTALKVSKALVSQGKAIDDAFNKLPLSVGRAFENVKTAFGQYIADADKGAGATAGLAQTLDTAAHNMRPLVDTAVTLGKLLAILFAGAALAAVGRYAAALVALAQAQHNANMVGRAQGEALIINAQRTVAHTQAQVADTQATLAVTQAARAETLARLNAANASIAQSQAAIAAMRSTVQTTSVLYLLRQEEAALAATQTQRIAIVTELATLSAQQVAVSNALTAATAAQTEAQVALNAVTVTAGGRMLAVLKSLLNPMNLLNLAMAAMAGYAIGEWANSFGVVRGTAVGAIHSIVSAFAYLENVAKKTALYLSFKPRDGVEGWHKLQQAVAELDAQYAADQAAREASKNAMLDEIIATENLSDETQKIISDFKAIKDPQQQFLQKQKELSDALKAGAINAKEYDAILQGLRKTMFEQIDANKSPFVKLKDELQDKVDKATLPPEAYQRKQLIKQGYSDEEIAQLLPYYARIESLSKSSQSQQRSAFKHTTDALLAEIKSRQDVLKTELDTELQQLKTQLDEKQLALKQQRAADEIDEQAYQDRLLAAEKDNYAKEYALKVDFERRKAALEQAEIDTKIKSAKLENPAGIFAATEIKYQLPSGILSAVARRESGGNDNSVSPKGAVGRMQLMPDTAKRFGVTDRTDPSQSIEGAAKYLRFLLDKFNGNLELALAGYNAGEGAVTGGYKNANGVYIPKHEPAIPNFPETQAYVPAVIQAMQNPQAGNDASALADQNAKIAALQADRLTTEARKNAAIEQLRQAALQKGVEFDSQEIVNAKAADDQQKALDAELTQTQHAAALADLDFKRQLADQELELGKITAEQHLQRLKELAAEELALRLKLLEDERKLHPNDPVAQAQISSEQQQLMIEFRAKVGDIDLSAIKTAKQEIESLFAPLENALNQSVNGILTGQQTIANAARNAAQSVVLSYLQQSMQLRLIKARDYLFEHTGMARLLNDKKQFDLLESAWDTAMCVRKRLRQSLLWAWEISGLAGVEARKKAIKTAAALYDDLLGKEGLLRQAGYWLLETLGFGQKEAAKVGVKVVGEQLQTVATAEGNVERAAIEKTANAESALGSAWKAAKGAFASVMEMVPFPFNIVLAPLAGMAAFAGTMALGSAKGGEWRVEEDGSPYILHKGESVLPAGSADHFRSVVDFVQNKGLKPVDVSAVVGDLVASGQLHGNWTIPATIANIPRESAQHAQRAALSARQADGADWHDRLAGLAVQQQPTQQPIKSRNRLEIQTLSAKDLITTHSKTIYKEIGKQARNFNLRSKV